MSSKSLTYGTSELIGVGQSRSKRTKSTLEVYDGLYDGFLDNVAMWQELRCCYLNDEGQCVVLELPRAVPTEDGA